MILLGREIAALFRLLFSNPRPRRTIAFYAENRGYAKYLTGFLEAVLRQSDFRVQYVTSDDGDPMLHSTDPRVRSHYVRHLAPLWLLLLDAPVLVLTVPDLNRFHLRRSINRVNHVYVFHAMVSTHMIYRQGAFDHYDTVLCTGPHQVTEIRRAEAAQSLRPKALLPVGYPLIDELHARHQEYLERRAATEGSGDSAAAPRTVLVAPSWHENNLLDHRGDELIHALLDCGYRVIVRPHPEFTRRRPQAVARLAALQREQPCFALDTDYAREMDLHTPEVLITDWSGIAFEYAFATERPVLFIDTPRKVLNHEYLALEIEPMEVKLRTVIGQLLDPARMDTTGAAVSGLIAGREGFRAAIRQSRAEYLYNWGQAAEIGARLLIELTTQPQSTGQEREP